SDGSGCGHAVARPRSVAPRRSPDLGRRKPVFAGPGARARFVLAVDEWREDDLAAVRIAIRHTPRRRPVRVRRRWLDACRCQARHRRLLSLFIREVQAKRFVVRDRGRFSPLHHLERELWVRKPEDRAVLAVAALELLVQRQPDEVTEETDRLLVVVVGPAKTDRADRSELLRP